MPIRCRWPPENAFGKRSACSGSSPTSSISSSTRRPIARAVGPPSARSGSARMSKTVRRGSSDPIGSWNTICSRRRRSRSAARPRRLGDVDAADPDGAVLRPAQVHDLEQRGGLAAPGLAHQAEGLALPDVQVDLRHRGHPPHPALQQRALQQRVGLAERRQLEHGRALVTGHRRGPVTRAPGVAGRRGRRRSGRPRSRPRGRQATLWPSLPRHRGELRFPVGAPGDRDRAAGCERAPRRQVDQQRRAARDRHQGRPAPALSTRGTAPSSPIV